MQQFSTLTADSMFVDVVVIMASAQCNIQLTIQQAFSQLCGIFENDARKSVTKFMYKNLVWYKAEARLGRGTWALLFMQLNQTFTAGEC